MVKKHKKVSDSKNTPFPHFAVPRNFIYDLFGCKQHDTKHDGHHDT